MGTRASTLEVTRTALHKVYSAVDNVSLKSRGAAYRVAHFCYNSFHVYSTEKSRLTS